MISEQMRDARLTGTTVNAAAVLAGSALGLAVGKHLPDKTKEIVLHGPGLASLAIGFQLCSLAGFAGKDYESTAHWNAGRNGSRPGSAADPGAS